MPSKSTILASLSLSGVILKTRRGDSIRSRNMKQWMSLAQRNTLDFGTNPFGARPEKI
jgi:hypothetical protein